MKTRTGPYLYIGSKEDISKFDDYWGSSKHLTDDIKKYGLHNFEKIILEKINYSSVSELLDIESEYQKKMNCIDSGTYYNKVYASPDFWTHGGGEYVKNTIWVNNGEKDVRISKTLLDSYTKSGYTIGRLKSPATFNKNRKYINNGKITKAVKESEVSSYLRNGWVVGRLRGNQAGKMWVNNGYDRKLVDNETARDMIKSGWLRGFHFTQDSKNDAAKRARNGCN